MKGYLTIRQIIYDTNEFLETKKKRLTRVKEDPLSKTIGICEGPTDLAEKHNKYKKENGKMLKDREN